MYRAATTINLTCHAMMGHEPLSYQWTTPCDDSGCFIGSNDNSSSIVRQQLQSRDTGDYTCTVTDSLNNTGSDTFEIIVVGKLIGRVTQLRHA